MRPNDVIAISGKTLMNDRLKALIAKYDVAHSGGTKCRCFAGAAGHLANDIVEYLQSNYVLTPKGKAPGNPQIPIGGSVYQVSELEVLGKLLRDMGIKNVRVGLPEQERRNALSS